MQQIPTLCLVEYQWRIDEKRNNRKVPLYLGSRTERAEYRSAWNVRLDPPIKRKEKRWNNKPTHKTVAKLCHLKRVRLLFLPTAHCLISIVQTVSNSIKLFTKQMNRATISVPLSIRIVYDRQQKEEVRKKIILFNSRSASPFPSSLSRRESLCITQASNSNDYLLPEIKILSILERGGICPPYCYFY